MARTYSPEDSDGFTRIFIEKAKEGYLIDLTEDAWSSLQNTDSFDIPKDGWDDVAHHTNHINQETGSTRNWEDLGQKIMQGDKLDVPIVLKVRDELHLVSGNTRLMVARALGKVPKILLIEM